MKLEIRKKDGYFRLGMGPNTGPGGTLEKALNYNNDPILLDLNFIKNDMKLYSMVLQSITIYLSIAIYANTDIE